MVKDYIIVAIKMLRKILSNLTNEIMQQTRFNTKIYNINREEN